MYATSDVKYTGGKGDNGIDIRVTNDYVDIGVQCKQGEQFKRKGPEIIRGFIGACVNQKIKLGFLFISNNEQITEGSKQTLLEAETNGDVLIRIIPISKLYY